jgi:hypothetical protein
MPRKPASRPQQRRPPKPRGPPTAVLINGEKYVRATPYTEVSLQLAVEACQIQGPGHLSLDQAAMQYRVPRSTLYDRL